MKYPIPPARHALSGWFAWRFSATRGATVLVGISAVRVALDAFATGYVTLSQLLSFHRGRIKIGRSVVSRLDQSDGGQVIVRAILGLANGFGLTTTAERVANTGPPAFLRANGCTKGRGFLFSKTAPADDIPALTNPPANYPFVA